MPTYPSGAPRTFVMVMSLSRSGSSLLSRLLADVLNIDFGEQIGHLPPDRHNPEGYYENYQILKLNERILADAGGNVFDPPPVDYAFDLDKTVREALVTRARRILATYSAESPFIGLKDPRLALTFPIWREAIEEQIRPLLIFRNPSAAAHSIFEQNPQVNWQEGLGLWWEYLYRMFYYSANLSRYVLSFERLQADPAQCLKGIAAHLGVTNYDINKVYDIVDTKQPRFQRRVEKVDLSPYIDPKSKLAYTYLSALQDKGMQPDTKELGLLLKGLHHYEAEYTKTDRLSRRKHQQEEAEIRQRLQQTLQDIGSLQNSIAVAAEQQQDLMNRLQAQEARSAELECKNTALTDETNRLSADNSQLAQELAAAKQSNTELTSENIRLQKKLTSSEQSNAKLNAELAAQAAKLKEERETHQGEMDNLRGEAFARHAGQQHRIDSLSARLAQLARDAGLLRFILWHTRISAVPRLIRRWQRDTRKLCFDDVGYLRAHPEALSAILQGKHKTPFAHCTAQSDAQAPVEHYLLPSCRGIDLFDPDHYLEQNPDVAAAVKAGHFASAQEHWDKTGKAEVMAGMRAYRHPMLDDLFDESSYLEQNPDVANAVAADGWPPSGLVHWQINGWKEWKQGDRCYTHPFAHVRFDPDTYLRQNPDVADAVLTGQFATAKDHWVNFGWKEVQAGTRHYNLDGVDAFANIPPMAANIPLSLPAPGSVTAAQGHQPLPLLSVVAAVYNKETSLPVFIDAFRRQTYAGPVELIFVDDISQDNSVEIIRDEAAKLEQEQDSGLKIKLLVNEDNSGNCFSRLRGVSEAEGEILFVMDADCIVNARFLEEHQRFHAKGLYHVVVGPMNIETNGRDPFQLLESLEDNGSLLEGEMDLQDPFTRNSFLNNITRNFSVRKAHISDELFDLDFSYSKKPDSGFGWEDVDMGLRLHLQGLATGWAQNAISVHLSHPSNVNDVEKPVKSMRNFKLLFMKHKELPWLATDWALETMGRLESWLDSVGKGDNADLAAVKRVFEKPEAAPRFCRNHSRRLKIVSYRWHCGHQYELHRLPHDFTLVQAGSITDYWDYHHRPKRENAAFKPLDQMRWDEYDLAILHFDEFLLRPELSRGILNDQWGEPFAEVFANFKGPKVAICHGVPYFHGACDIMYDSALRGKIIHEERQRILDYLGDTLVITNSHRACREWGFPNSRVIWHGFDPKEYPPTGYELDSLIAVGQMLKRPWYRGMNVYLSVVDKLARQGIEAPDFLGDQLKNQVKLPNIYGASFDDPTEQGRAHHANYINFLRRYSVFFNSTLTSPMPRTRAEAMLCGLAVVTTNCHDEDMFIDNEANGFFSNDPTQLADYLATLHKDKGLAREVGARGRQRAMEVFHINDYLNEWNEVIADLVGESRPAGNVTRPGRYQRTATKATANRPSVLFIGGVGGDTERYRVDHMVEGLRAAGVTCRKLSFTSPECLSLIEGAMDDHDVIVLHRVAYGTLPSTFFGDLKNKNKLLIFDTDDLVFHKDFVDYFEKMGLATDGLRGLAPALRETIQFCDASTCSTHFLRRRLEAEGATAHVVRNCFSSEMLRIADLARQNKPTAREWIEIGYPSGTPTHRLDLASITEPLIETLKAHPNTRFHVIGPLELPPELEAFGERILRSEFTSWKRLPLLLAGFDINLAPLVIPEPFCQAKSELKWLEAGLVGVPSVCSKTDAFAFAVQDGVDGYLADDHAEWHTKLTRLVRDGDLRKRMGDAARGAVAAKYHCHSRGQELLELFTSLLAARK